MTKRLLLCVLAVAVLSSEGCMFFRKSKKPKESSAISSDVEKEFRGRWIMKRTADLTAQGQAPAASQDQANREFQEKFAFALPSK